MIEVSYYLTGFARWRRLFLCVISTRAQRHRFGWEIRPSFRSVRTQTRVAAPLLALVRSTGDAESIRPDRSDKTLKYEVRSESTLILVETALRHFQCVPVGVLESKLDD